MNELFSYSQSIVAFFLSRPYTHRQSGERRSERWHEILNCCTSLNRGQGIDNELIWDAWEIIKIWQRAKDRVWLLCCGFDTGLPSHTTLACFQHKTFRSLWSILPSVVLIFKKNLVIWLHEHLKDVKAFKTFENIVTVFGLVTDSSASIILHIYGIRGLSRGQSSRSGEIFLTTLGMNELASFYETGAIRVWPLIAAWNVVSVTK